jgi:hypothetical protein
MTPVAIRSGEMLDIDLLLSHEGRVVQQSVRPVVLDAISSPALERLARPAQSDTPVSTGRLSCTSRVSGAVVGRPNADRLTGWAPGTIHRS